MTTLEQDDAEVRELRHAVGRLEIPPLASDAFARIVARREGGERVALLLHDAQRMGPVRRARIVAFALTALAAAAVAFFALPRLRSGGALASPDQLALDPADSACANLSTTSDSSMLRHLMISSFGVPAACGAEPVQDVPIGFRPSQIETGTFTYGSTSITDGVFTSVHPPYDISISRTSRSGQSAILAVREGPPATGVHLDSLIVSAVDLTPLYWASIYTTQHPRGAIHAWFDSARVTITTIGRLDTTASFSFQMQSGQLPFGFALPLAVPALPLATGWRGVVAIAPPVQPRAHDRFLKPWETLSLRVVGRERITVAAGSFDCWKVQVGEPGDRAFLWVSTESHLVIRSISISRTGDSAFEDRHELQRMILTQH